MDIDISYKCSLCGLPECECGPCDMCPSHDRKFHVNNKDGLCEKCVICPTCKRGAMFWDNYDEAWSCSFCVSEWDEHNMKEMAQHPYHTVRKDVPIYIKDKLWTSSFGSAKEAKCSSCQMCIRPQRFCCVQKGEDFLAICVQCSKDMGSMRYEEFIGLPQQNHHQKSGSLPLSQAS